MAAAYFHQDIVTIFNSIYAYYTQCIVWIEMAVVCACMGTFALAAYDWECGAREQLDCEIRNSHNTQLFYQFSSPFGVTLQQSKCPLREFENPYTNFVYASSAFMFVHKMVYLVCKTPNVCMLLLFFLHSIDESE